VNGCAKDGPAQDSDQDPDNQITSCPGAEAGAVAVASEQEANDENDPE
jgi:hypothetical protein